MRATRPLEGGGVCRAAADGERVDVKHNSQLIDSRRVRKIQLIGRERRVGKTQIRAGAPLPAEAHAQESARNLTLHLLAAERLEPKPAIGSDRATRPILV